MRRRLPITMLSVGVSLFVLLSLARVRDTNGQTLLPTCQQEVAGNLVFPSPHFAHDDTLFWIDPSENSLWRSQDNSETWLQVFKFASNPLLPATIEQFQMTPHSAETRLTLYLGVDDIFHRQYHLYRSEQTGDGWEEVTAPCTSFDVDCPDNYSLRAAGQTPVLFQPRWWYFEWSPLPFGVARSEDGGMTWQMVWDETHAWNVAVSPDYDNDQTLWATLMSNSPTLGTAFILSHDGGETWQAAGQGMCDDLFLYSDLEVSPGYTRDGALLMGIYQNSLFQSKDGGLTWQAIFPRGATAVCDSSLTDLDGYHPRFAPDYPEDPTIYVATNKGLYASYNDGQSWRRLTESGTVFSLEVARQASVSTIRPAGVNEPVSDTSSGVGSSALLHQVFLPRVVAPGSPTPVRPYSLFMRAYVAGTFDAYMYRSDDGGATWECMEKPQVHRRAYLPLLRQD